MSTTADVRQTEIRMRRQSISLRALAFVIGAMVFGVFAFLASGSVAVAFLTALVGSIAIGVAMWFATATGTQAELTREMRGPNGSND